jgi:uncharacterized protein Yka (UPF0111/DUF47 family)
MSFIKKFILPKEIDFDTALQAQARITRMIVSDLHSACIDDEIKGLDRIIVHADEARTLKTKNMNELLDVFIAPYDKESIYRITTQLDWIALSVKHFKLEAEVYGVASIGKYQSIVELLLEMASLLEQCITRLSAKSPRVISLDTDIIHDQYDYVVLMCARSVAELLKKDDCKQILIHRDILAQLKEIAKRIHVTANTLEDMAIKLA